MSILAVTLSFALPCTLYIHAIWRLFCAAGPQLKAFALVPAMSFAFATLWLAQSIMAQYHGGLSDDAARAQLTIGLWFVGFMVFMTEIPFLVRYLHTRRAAKRRK